MTRPHITCLMMTSLDGRIRAKNWALKKSEDVYEQEAAKIPWDAWVVGRVTMQGFTDTKPRAPRRGTFRVPPGDFVADYRQKRFAVGIDPHGKLKFKTNHAETEHIISVVTEQATAEHLDYLRSKNVSYIIGGRRHIDLEQVVKRLGTLFPIKHLSVQGGGKVNGSFLKAGLIDELHLMLMPLADGTIGSPALFDVQDDNTRRRATRFRLKSCQPRSNGMLMLHYVAK